VPKIKTGGFIFGTPPFLRILSLIEPCFSMPSEKEFGQVKTP
jgi:hypothetical protein